METNQMSRQSKGQLKVTVRADTDKDGSAIRSTIMFPDADRSRVNQSLAEPLAASQATFGNRMEQQQHLYQSVNIPTSAGRSAPLDQNDDDFDVDRE